MTISYDNRLKIYGNLPIYCEYGYCRSYIGTYIEPNGDLINLAELSQYDRHNADWHSFSCTGEETFARYISPPLYRYYNDKKRILESISKKIPEIQEKIVYNPNDLLLQQIYRIDLHLLEFFMRCYKSRHVKIHGNENGSAFFDLSDVIGLALPFEINKEASSSFYKWRAVFPYDKTLQKEILVRYCGYDSVEGILPSTIVSSAFNVNDRFYDIQLGGDYHIQQVPKMVWDEEEDRYVERQSGFFVPDRELRLAGEIEAVKKYVPLSERSQYFRSSKK